jgi:uncharacterized membrane protein
VLAALAFDLALQPTLLPRPWWVQGVFVGIATAQTYLVARVAVVVCSAIRRLRELARASLAAPRPERSGRRRRAAHAGPGAAGARSARLAGVLWCGLALLLVVSAVAGQAREAALDRGVALDPGSWDDQVMRQSGSVLLALVTALAVSGAPVLVHQGLRALRRRVVQRVVRPSRGCTSLPAALMVPVMALAGCTASGLPGGTPAAAAAPPAIVPVADVGSARPVEPLGIKGRQFVRGVTPMVTIAAAAGAAGRPTVRPVRVYAGLRSGEGDEARAARGVEDLRRAGGLTRAVVVVVVPTGSGWVDPAAMTAVESLTGGDVATLAVQYAQVPSWIAYLQGSGGAERSAAAAITTVRRLVDTLPVERRPRLLVYGESLGALGGLRAQDAQPVPLDGALWVGVPTDAAGLASRAARAGQGVLVHADDPVAAWSADLALRPAAGWLARWWPVVTFWQATADLVAAYSTPAGHGHRYGSELMAAWRTTLHHVGFGPVQVDQRP